MSLPELNPLDITPLERRKLRGLKIRKLEMHRHSVKALQKMMNVSRIRAMELYALSEFQSLPSVGIRCAHDLISMGYYSLKSLKGKNGAKLTDKFEQLNNAWTDPCVEDQFRLIVHYAGQPNSKLNWWDFTAERKMFREKHGYPANRPKQAWFNLPANHTSARIPASREETQKDLHIKLKKAIAYMKKHFAEALPLKLLAETACLSQYHFLRCFKSAYEITPLQFLTRLRLKKATWLLTRTNTIVGSIAPRCGFENESSFIRLFRKQFRMTPIAYRKTFRRSLEVNGTAINQ